MVSAVPEVKISFLGESLLHLSSDFAKKLIWGTSDLYKLPTVAKALINCSSNLIFIMREGSFTIRHDIVNFSTA